MPQLCVPAVERVANELCSLSLNSLEKVYVRLQHFAGPYASLAVPSTTQAKGALDSRDMCLRTLRGSVVVMIRRSAVNDGDLVEVADLSEHGTWIYTRSFTTWWRCGPLSTRCRRVMRSGRLHESAVLKTSQDDAPDVECTAIELRSLSSFVLQEGSGTTWQP